MASARSSGRVIVARFIHSLYHHLVKSMNLVTLNAGKSRDAVPRGRSLTLRCATLLTFTARSHETIVHVTSYFSPSAFKFSNGSQRSCLGVFHRNSIHLRFSRL